MTMVAAVLHGFGSAFAIEPLTIDQPRRNEVQVRMAATGICQTDVKWSSSDHGLPLPLVMGHEGAGIITAVGDEAGDLAIGDHVVLSYASCGSCPSCLAAKPYHCDNIGARNMRCTRDDGTTALARGEERVHSHFFGQSSFAQHANVDARCVVKVDPKLPLEMMGPLGCGIQTGAGAVLNVFKAGPGSSIAIFGAGAVGLSAVMAAAVAGATTIIAVDTIESRLALALELGATHVIDARREDGEAAILRLKPGGVDYSLDTTGSSKVVSQACAVLASAGTCGIVSSSEELAIAPGRLVRKGLRIHGISEGESNPQIFIPRLIELYAAGRFPFDRLITFYPFDEINQAVADARAGKAIKPVLRFA